MAASSSTKQAVITYNESTMCWPHLCISNNYLLYISTANVTLHENHPQYAHLQVCSYSWPAMELRVSSSWDTLNVFAPPFLGAQGVPPLIPIVTPIPFIPYPVVFAQGTPLSTARGRHAPRLKTPASVTTHQHRGPNGRRSIQDQRLIFRI